MSAGGQQQKQRQQEEEEVTFYRCFSVTRPPILQSQAAAAATTYANKSNNSKQKQKQETTTAGTTTAAAITSSDLADQLTTHTSQLTQAQGRVDQCRRELEAAEEQRNAHQHTAAQFRLALELQQSPAATSVFDHFRTAMRAFLVTTQTPTNNDEMENEDGVPFRDTDDYADFDIIDSCLDQCLELAVSLQDEALLLLASPNTSNNNSMTTSASTSVTTSNTSSSGGDAGNGRKKKGDSNQQQQQQSTSTAASGAPTSTKVKSAAVAPTTSKHTTTTTPPSSSSSSSAAMECLLALIATSMSIREVAFVAETYQNNERQLDDMQNEVVNAVEAFLENELLVESTLKGGELMRISVANVMRGLGAPFDAIQIPRF